MALSQLGRAYRERSLAAARALVQDTINIEQWYQRQRRLALAVHLAAYEAARGRRLTDADRALVRSLFEKQEPFLRNWRDELLANLPNEATILRRALMYLPAADATYQRGVTDRIGLPVLPAYPRDGTTTCLIGCKCVWEILSLAGAGNFDLRWLTRPVEHCKECVRRGEEWFPLKVREGVIIRDYNEIGLFKSSHAA